eukprot:c45191_g1_i1 orf=2-166(-)
MYKCMYVLNYIYMYVKACMDVSVYILQKSVFLNCFFPANKPPVLLSALECCSSSW